MEKIILFSRCELPHLYGRLDKHLRESFEIIHLAYSLKEVNILSQEYGIQNIINFKEEVNKIFISEKFDIKLCNEIDKLIIEQSDGRFCLNSAIQYDRTFKYIPYSDALILSQVYYKFWNNLIKINEIKCIIHEPTAIYFTHIASIICKKYNSQYLGQIQVIGENKQNWIFTLGDNGFPVELAEYSKENHLSSQDVQRVENYIARFRAENTPFFSEYSKEKRSHFGGLLGEYIFSNLKLFARHLLKFLSPYKQNSLNSINHMELFSLKYQPSFIEKFRTLWDNYFYLKYDTFDPHLDFYYYPIHFEPEAVVLYWGDGIYENQVKLIENIASQLPPNCYLYVKDHPHGGAYRAYVDYKRIKEIPNVKLLSPYVPGRNVITKARGVITINGTSGFEALILNKQVYAFGQSFYTLSNRVHKIKNIRDLQKQLYNNYTKTYNDDSELYSFINSYLNSTHEGFTNYFPGYAELCGIDNDKNAETVAQGITNYLKKI
jgi:hypothetical protein